MNPYLRAARKYTQLTQQAQDQFRRRSGQAAQSESAKAPPQAEGPSTKPLAAAQPPKAVPKAIANQRSGFLF
jgi:hypothetical protein